MNVNVTAELEAFVQEKVQSGLYNSASEVIRESLRLLKEKEDLKRMQVEHLRHEIALGLKDLDEGRKVAFDAKAVEGIKARGRAKAAQRNGKGTK
jgi:antitoxin ParD1/3/4